MSQTTHLGLTLTSTDEWPSKKYRDYILEQAGTDATSNMQIIDAAVQRIDEALENADFDPTSVVEQNNQEDLTFWVGTKAEYDAIETKDPLMMYVVTDEDSGSTDQYITLAEFTELSAQVEQLTSDMENMAVGEHTHNKEDITDFAHTHTKSEVTDFEHTHEMGEISGLEDALANVGGSGNADAVQANLNAHTGNTNNPHGVTYSQTGAAAEKHTHLKSEITDFPSSMPASDVYAWAKAATKPTYTYDEVGAAASTHTHTVASLGLAPTFVVSGTLSYSGEETFTISGLTPVLHTMYHIQLQITSGSPASSYLLVGLGAPDQYWEVAERQVSSSGKDTFHFFVVFSSTNNSTINAMTILGSDEGTSKKSVIGYTKTDTSIATINGLYLSGWVDSGTECTSATIAYQIYKYVM